MNTAHNFNLGDIVKFTGTWDNIAHVRLLHSDDVLQPVLNGQLGEVVNVSAYGTGNTFIEAKNTEDNVYPMVLVRFNGIDEPLCLGVNNLVKEEHGSSNTSASRRDARPGIN